MTSALGELVWSRSKVNALRECQRKFYFLNTSSQAELKKLKNRHLWSGSIVHDAIGSILKALRQGEPLSPPSDVIEATRKKMREEFRESKQDGPPEAKRDEESHEILRPPRRTQNDSFRLFEHEYSIPLDARVWQNHWEAVEKKLRWFLSSRWAARLSELPPESWKAVDELLHFDVDGIKAYVKIDCAVEVGGRFVLVDWKASQLKTSDEFSLLVGALYAHEVWGADAENIDALAVSLQDGRQLKAVVNEESLIETFLKIQEDGASLGEETQRQNGLAYDQIPMTSDTRQCERCNFKKVCYA